MVLHTVESEYNWIKLAFNNMSEELFFVSYVIF